MAHLKWLWNEDRKRKFWALVWQAPPARKGDPPSWCWSPCKRKTPTGRKETLKSLREWERAWREEERNKGVGRMEGHARLTGDSLTPVKAAILRIIGFESLVASDIFEAMQINYPDETHQLLCDFEPVGARATKNTLAEMATSGILIAKPGSRKGYRVSKPESYPGIIPFPLTKAELPTV